MGWYLNGKPEYLALFFTIYRYERYTGMNGIPVETLGLIGPPTKPNKQQNKMVFVAVYANSLNRLETRVHSLLLKGLVTSVTNFQGRFPVGSMGYFII